MKQITLLLWLTMSLIPHTTHALDIMLAKVYTSGVDVTGWLMSEKMDGVRGYWDGKRLLSKNGNPLHPPTAFTHNFPPFPLEGELWGGRQTFQKTMSIVKKQQPHDNWLELKFAIFDVPQHSGGFTQRIKQAKEWFSNHPTQFAFVVEQKTISSRDQLQTELQRVEQLDGEGLIVRKPNALYTTGRSSKILKVKTSYDMEAVVIAHNAGKGRNQGRLGSLLVEIPDKIRFKIGTGFSDEQRNHPPPIGSNITFKYYGFFESGRPRFPSFIRIRTDVSL